MIAAKRGGKYLSGSGNVQAVEGGPPDVSLIAAIDFLPRDAARAFATDPEYAPYLWARQKGSISGLYVIEDTDTAGTIPYLPKGDI